MHLTLWISRDMCYTDKGSLPQSFMWWLGDLNIYSKSLSAVFKEWVGCYAWEGVLNNVISALKFVKVLLYLLRVWDAWCTTGIYHLTISAFFNPIHLDKV